MGERGFLLPVVGMPNLVLGIWFWSPWVNGLGKMGMVGGPILTVRPLISRPEAGGPNKTNKMNKKIPLQSGPEGRLIPEALPPGAATEPCS